MRVAPGEVLLAEPLEVGQGGDRLRRLAGHVEPQLPRPRPRSGARRRRLRPRLGRDVFMCASSASCGRLRARPLVGLAAARPSRSRSCSRRSSRACSSADAPLGLFLAPPRARSAAPRSGPRAPRACAPAPAACARSSCRRASAAACSRASWASRTEPVRTPSGPDVDVPQLDARGRSAGTRGSGWSAPCRATSGRTARGCARRPARCPAAAARCPSSEEMPTSVCSRLRRRRASGW